MSIIVNKDSKVLVQGFTGSEGTFHSEQMIEYGTNVVCGVTPGKGGTKHLDKPVYNSVADALNNEDINTSIIFVPPMFAADAIMEAAESGIKTIVTITEGIPVNDMTKVVSYIKGKNIRLIGPNCPGIITPEEAKIDPWGKPYRYFFSNDGYAIQSAGPDGVFAEGHKSGRDDQWYSRSLLSSD